ncbi:ABC transporter [Streptomyces pilosus]|uniref:ABC transporter n=1 Tax=Streptomyces pilosus TaxID=28893 RepID=A0A918F5J0_9ACTN|nr:ABC transporter [Streptomyces pilosus]GGR02826.1 ABC transporter [Streptomyces pilosus]
MPVNGATTRGVPVAQLLRPVARTLPWWTLAAGGGLGLLLAAAPRLTGDGASGGSVPTALRAAALAFALGAAFWLDDPARHTTAAVPARRALRHGLRLALLAPVAALWWTAALLLVPQPVRPPVAGITVEAATALALALTGAACAVHRGDGTRPGPAVAGFLLVTAVLSPLLCPEDWALFVAPGDERWPAAHDRWAVLLGVVLVAGAACLTEPLRRHRLRRLRSPSGT